MLRNSLSGKKIFIVRTAIRHRGNAALRILSKEYDVKHTSALSELVYHLLNQVCGMQYLQPGVEIKFGIRETV